MRSCPWCCSTLVGWSATGARLRLTSYSTVAVMCRRTKLEARSETSSLPMDDATVTCAPKARPDQHEAFGCEGRRGLCGRCDSRLLRDPSRRWRPRRGVVSECSGVREQRKRDDYDIHFLAETPQEDCWLLEPQNRVFPVPRTGPKGTFVMGRSNVRYTDKREAQSFVRSLREYMEDPDNWPRRTPGSAPRQSDPELRAKVERPRSPT